ncbi:helix-turn-helix domain-containing protein [Prescottella subtropica]|uniref:helix-turn-helix domain-containing protein n=1 Tax=Prescottella subtropica TaxID=2545757 RepID=UPI0010F60D0A|nr:helix-turn-helix domain-containing protein [Prescottella subtropica]
MTSVEDRYLTGELDFEAAAAHALGAPSVDRELLVPILRALEEAAHPVSAISAADAALLDAGGAPEAPMALAAAVADRQARMRDLWDDALTVEQAATRLGVSTSRIRQRAGDRTLWAIKRGHRLLFPAVQFTEGGQVPGLDTVLSALPEDLHPLSVLGLLTTAQPELRIGGGEASIVDWLAGGGAVESATTVVDAHLRA